MRTGLLHSGRRWPACLWWAPALLLAAILAGCEAQPTQIATEAVVLQPVGAPTAELPTPLPTPASNSTAEPASAITLTMWTAEWFSPTQAITSGQVLAEQKAAFEAAHPRARLQFVLKEPYGEAGLLNFMLRSGAVVPELLPDLIVLDADELATAVQAGRVQPLDGLLPAELVANLYPFAREAGSYDGRLYGLQFLGDLDHLVYDTGRIPLPPRSWPGVLSTGGPYLFPAGGRSGLANDAFLTQYLAVREQTGAGDDAEAFLDATSLATTLQFYDDALSRGVVPADVANYHSTDEAWSAYLNGQASLVQVSAHRYLVDRHRLSTSAVAAIPGMHGPAAPLSRGWVIALVTNDPARQPAAVDWMAQLLTAETNAAWNRAAGYLPTRAAALELWQPDQAYGRFIGWQLQQAHARPLLPSFTRVSAALQEAVAAVLSGTLTPEQAAAQAIANNQ